MQILRTTREVKKLRKLKSESSVGFVPTMGALHNGHLSLIERSKKENKISVVSIFVNPTQFNDPNDYKNYPNTFEEDNKYLENLDVDYLFCPNYEELYNDNYKYQILENELSKDLCGASREGHFTGVLTVVMKLLNIVSPNKAYFGEKDYQQFLLIKGMAEAFHMDVEIISSPTIRENNGLAMSSRNLLLKKEERKIAPKFYENLNSDLTDDEVIENLVEEGFKIDYIRTIKNRRFGAVHLGDVRLIDNVEK